MNESPFREKIPQETESVAKDIVDAAFRVHKTLGPGLLEAVYEKCLVYELKRKQLSYQTQVAIPVVYEEVKLETGFRADVIVEDRVIVELKTVEQLMKVHEAQVLTYMKLGGYRLGLLINFNVALIKDGMRRFVI